MKYLPNPKYFITPQSMLDDDDDHDDDDMMGDEL